MERGQRRSPQQPYRGQPQRPTQRPPQRRPVQSGRPSIPGPYKLKRHKSRKPIILGVVVLLAILLTVILILSGRSAPSNERILGKWTSSDGSMFEFFDSGVVGQYIPAQPELGIESIITTSEWELREDVLIIDGVSAECFVKGDVLRWGKAEYFR